MEPHVPGPGLPNPAPKNVAIVHAQNVRSPVFTGVSTAAGSFVMRVAVSAHPAQVFEDVGGENRRTDLVDPRGPFAEIDLAATVAAEREVLIIEADQHIARRTAQNFCGFFL